MAMGMQLLALEQLSQPLGTKPSAWELRGLRGHGWNEKQGPAQAADWAMWVRRGNSEETKSISLPRRNVCGDMVT